MPEKVYNIPSYTGSEREKYLNSIFLKREIFDNMYHWPELNKTVNDCKDLFNNEYFKKGQLIKAFAGRTIPFKLLSADKEIQMKIKSYMNLCRFLGQSIIHERTGELHFPDNTELTRWESGRDMTPHSDNSWPDGDQKDHPTSFRTWSAIYYINDDYEGGEIYFPGLDWHFKPEANTLLIFPSNEKYIHGVNKITEGERYTFAIWYTQDFRYLEI